MQKKSFQDFIKTKKNNSNLYGKDLIPNNKNKIKIWEVDASKDDDNQKNENLEIKEYIKFSDNKDNSKYGLWFVAFISVIFLFFALSYVFMRARIVVIPKSENIILDQNFSAVKNSNIDDLSFDLVVLQGEESKILATTEKKDISLSATGKVRIYNNFSLQDQKLLIDTRLEGSNGKLYKTKTPITVPGIKNNVPGSVEVDIYADEKGEDSNASQLDFKIFGFKGTSKYDKFYARSVTDITGGMQGSFNVASESDKDLAIKELEETLKNKLFQKIKAQIPNGFVIFEDSVVFVKENDPNSIYLKEDSSIVLKGSLYGFLFNKEKLSNQILSKNIQNFKGEKININDISKLSFILNSKDKDSFSEISEISFNLKGNLIAVWDIDSKNLIKDLVKKKKDDFNQVLLNYPNIDSAELTIRPFWKNSFPDKDKNIKIIINELKE